MKKSKLPLNFNATAFFRLICSAPYIQREGDKGIIHQGPGGPLHHFLSTHAGQNPVLIVNYSQFTASDIVRFNALLDAERSADGTPLSADTQVIGILDKDNPAVYDGADFYSRFGQQGLIDNPLSSQQLVIPIVVREQQAEAYPITLYGSSDWEERLLGQWVMQDKALHFVEGELVRALGQNAGSVELINAPWDNAEFQCFWQEALLKGSFDYQGVHYSLPEGFQLSATTQKELQLRREQLTVHESDVIPADAFILNPGSLSTFFGVYTCNNEQHSIRYQEGLLKQRSNSSLSLYLSDALSLDDWARLLDASAAQGIRLQLTLAPHLKLPEALKVPFERRIEPKEPQLWNPERSVHTAYIHSTDIDATLASLTNPETLVIDVSEVNPSQLLLKLHADFDETTVSFHFTEQTGALLEALHQNQKVVLKGQIKDDLRYALSALLLQRQRESSPQGRLLIVSDKPDLFPLLAPAFTQTVRAEDKRTLLKIDKDLLSDEELNRSSLAQLQAMLRYKKLHPKESGTNAWLGFNQLPPTSLKHHEDNVNQQRFDQVSAVLNLSPMVFLAGMTGVGKTTFIHDVWKKSHPACHFGENNLLAWAHGNTQGIKTLFIDEANISSRQWSEFEGLFQTPARILIDNKIHSLSPNHKVIFAGNPLSYGGERQMPSLFQRHGNSVIFEPLPPAFLYQEVLLPILKPLEQTQEVAAPILKIAQYLTTLNPNEVLLSPRELSMMALLTVTYCTAHPKANPVGIAQYYAYTLAEHHVPEKDKTAFTLQFKPGQELQWCSSKKSEKILVSPSNQPAFDALTSFMALRTLRQNKAIQADGGLGGLILEGEPGLGKSELVIHTLLAHGLKKGKLNQSQDNDQAFYLIPASMSFDEKSTLLMHAFHSGAVVVMDEINSAPMMERLLNEVLMGKDSKGKPAQKPGFLLIGTQNPATMAGRARASSALKHRMQTVLLPEYSEQEFLAILHHKGLPQSIASPMVKEYLSFNQKARQHNTPLLCCRDLLNCAQYHLEASARPKATPDLEEEQTFDSERILDELDLSAFQEDKVLQELIQAIRNALNETGDTDTIKAAVLLVQSYIKQPRVNVEVLAQCSISLNLLADEIERYSTQKSLAGRALSALQGLGLALMNLGIALVQCIPRAAKGLTLLSTTVQEGFEDACERFNETWSGKVKPPELNQLNRKVKALKATISNKEPSSFSFFNGNEEKEQPRNQNSSKKPGPMN